MFPNATMMKPETWNDVLAAMIGVRDAHGWAETTSEVLAPKLKPRLAAACSQFPWRLPPGPLRRHEGSQHRPRRLRLHGPDAFERVPAGTASSTCRIGPC